MLHLHLCDPPIIHRDLKSPNLLVDKHWKLKVRHAPAVWPAGLQRLCCSSFEVQASGAPHSLLPAAFHSTNHTRPMLFSLTLQVCDFNLSRVMEESVVLSSMVASNPRWLAPEILAGLPYTVAADVYSFGVIMWELLTWEVPWHQQNTWQVWLRCCGNGAHVKCAACLLLSIPDLVHVSGIGLDTLAGQTWCASGLL